MENSNISWTDSTQNFWMGCTKKSVGCQHCYAENMMDHRYGKVKWGPQGIRVRTSAAKWKEPLRWNKDNWLECNACHWRGSVKKAEISKSQPSVGMFECPVCHLTDMATTRQRVFCSSLSDFFEDKPELVPWRIEALKVIEQCYALDWLLLTKRPENVVRMIEQAQDAVGAEPNARGWLTRFSNVWIGTSVENQDAADERIPHLLNVPAAVRFLSCEPLLGPVDLRGFSYPYQSNMPGLTSGHDWLTGEQWQHSSIFGGGSSWLTTEEKDEYGEARIHWVIAGGESGASARPTHRDWIRCLRDQCVTTGTAFHFKQWGEWAPVGQISSNRRFTGDNLHHWGNGDYSVKFGKSTAGRVLDGRTWDEFPNSPWHSAEGWGE